MRFPLCASVGILAALAACSLQAQVDFSSTIHPILASRCAGCHGGAKPQASLSFASRDALLKGGVSGPAIVPGSGQLSLLVQRVSGQHGAVMPPVGEPLTTAQITALRTWIDEGAPWTDTQPKAAPTWKAPLEPRTPELPASSYTHPVDRFIEAYLKRKNVPFPAPVADALFARRAYLDLWGLLPTPEQTASFVKDTRDDKRARLIDTLLAEPRYYSEHWISFWNDLLRNDQGVVYHGGRKSITPWLQSALAQNMPYDQMVAALLNPTAPADPDGFLLGVNWRGDVSASQTPPMQAAQNSAQVFLGVNLKCASCHDSFINKYTLKQSYGMAALFSEENSLELVRCDLKTGQRTGPAFLFPEIGTVPADASQAERHAAAARLFTSPQNGRLARTMVNRIWQRLMGRGLVEPVDEMDAEPWNPDLLDWLASDFAAHQYDLHHLIRQVMSSRAYQLPAIVEAPDKQFTFRGPMQRRLTAEQFTDAVSQLTGEWRLLQSENGATYSREWQLKSTALTRAMGRPIRDQVYTTRDGNATTLQMLELSNGETLATMLRRGARRLFGQLPPAPAPVFDSKTIRKGSIPVDIDISQAKSLWLLLEDSGSYDPARTVAGWADVELSGPKGTKRLQDLVSLSPPAPKPLTAAGTTYTSTLVTPLSSTLVYPIEGLGFTRLRGQVAVDDAAAQASDVGPAVRFYVFASEPDRHQLVKLTGEPPVPAPPVTLNSERLIERLYWQALSRAPSAREKAIAQEFLQGAKAQKTAAVSGLEDLLWSLLLHPEFQFIR